MTLIRSWVTSANSPKSPFPLNNLPYGVFSTLNQSRRLGVAIGDQIVDVLQLKDVLPVHEAVLSDPRGWNGLMDQESSIWVEFRDALSNALVEGAPERPEALIPQNQATMHMPFAITEFTDFYASKHHAINVGTMFRGREKALPPNWLHIPIGL